jgi:uncharacterized damage-inducible protein DinB
MRTEATRFLATYLREHATTLKVLRAFPTGQSEFRPHARSNDAKQLAWTFVVEEQLMLKALKHEQVLGGGFPPAPESWSTVLDAFSATHDEIVALLADPANAGLDGTATFFSGPKQTSEYPTSEFLWFMLMDQVHHRGQLSVYVRMTGGKVPSIYGPSADEPWF